MTTEITPTTTKTRRNFSFLFALTLVGLLVLICVALSIATPNFATGNNISNLLRQGSMIAILAIGQTFVIITAGIDLSVGAIVGFSTVVVAGLIQSGMPVYLAIIITLIMGLLIGFFHAFGIVKMGLPPFIITLATLTSLRGIGLLMTNGSTINITDAGFNQFSRESFLGVPNLFWMVIIVAVPAFVFLHLSKWGRYLYAVGSNPEAARLSGVSVAKMIYIAYGLSAKEVAHNLSLSCRTVDTFRTRALLKLRARNTADAVRMLASLSAIAGPPAEEPAVETAA